MRLLGNTVLVEPLPDAHMQTSASGIYLPNKYGHSNLKFKVLAVGPGEHIKRGKKLRFVQPEVQVGDCIICRAELDHDVVKHAFDDGTGRLLIRGDAPMLSWRE